MAISSKAMALSAEFVAQPSDARLVPDEVERNRLVISMSRVQGSWSPRSVYGDSVWWLAGATTNMSESRSKINFAKVPACFQEAMKAMIYRYLRRGARGHRRPGAATIATAFEDVLIFLRFAEGIGISRLRDVAPLVSSAYVQAARGSVPKTGTTKPGADPTKRRLSSGKLYKRLRAVELVFEMSQYTSDCMESHPWVESSAGFLAGVTGVGKATGGLTPLIPDDIFANLFQKAWAIVQGAPRLLDLLDEVQKCEQRSDVSRQYHAQLKSKILRGEGLEGYRELKKLLRDVRVACYVVVASLSGCRAHEMANIRTHSYYSTEVDGETFWWLRSVSTKTFEGSTEWMIPEAAVEALRIMDRWVQPYQRILADEIKHYSGVEPDDHRIAEAQGHVDAVFVGTDTKKSNQVRTLSVQQLNVDLKDFAVKCGLQWLLATHQFRRKFANYAARSQFGDLRYLREHFKHWSMDMTLGYALNELQEMSLYLEIQDELDDIKVATVSSWLDDSEPLGGGYGRALVEWRARDEHIVMFKSRAAMVRSIALSTPIRSNGHAWCTAADNLCVGNDLERTRCGDGCDNAVVGSIHKQFYQGLYDHLRELKDTDDIGPGGRARVTRDMERCANVLGELGQKVQVLDGNA